MKQIGIIEISRSVIVMYVKRAQTMVSVICIYNLTDMAVRELFKFVMKNCSFCKFWRSYVRNYRFQILKYRAFNYDCDSAVQMIFHIYQQMPRV